MPSGTLKDALRRVARRLGSHSGRGTEHASAANKGTEKSDVYYDDAFHRNTKFQVPFYKSSYYPTWMVIVDRLRAYGCEAILDIGCGPGQFAALVEDCGFRSYTGVDFSSVAIEMAQARTRRSRFKVGDVRRPDTYEGLDYDAVVCMEVLEHVEEDLAVLSCFPAGTRCLLTVPNFPWRSHVRHFDSEAAVAQRYGRFFQQFLVTRIKGVRTDEEQFYLLDGVRSGVVQS
jgi:SAM-dependent methyltransferase